MFKKFFAKFKKKKIEPIQEETTNEEPEFDQWEYDKEKLWEQLKERLGLDDPVGYKPKYYKR